MGQYEWQKIAKAIQDKIDETPLGLFEARTTLSVLLGIATRMSQQNNQETK